MLNRVVLITGASSGIGAACAQRLAAEGDRVYGTSRHPGDETDTPGVQMLAMDVNSDESVTAAIEQLVRAEGRIDVVVNNAGFGIAGAVEDTSIEEAKALFETNFFGMLRVCRAVLPTMRRAHQGIIVNISSLGGLIGLPYQGLYSATKFAVEGMTEALRMEVRQFGIRVIMIEPGDFRTEFTANRLYVAGSKENSAYKESFERAINVVEKDEQGGSSPKQIAALLVKVLAKRSPKVRYSVGGMSQRGAAVLKQIVPNRFFEWALMKYYRV
ncbi:SDR family NAD(P)-dependent oxidoreductase [Candidatus Bipolaricaulota bacterium]|nr:SDR family NAD(P)-dependent oxidoreductase [Candidatus Bipolaricaulota bacterium]